MDRWPLLRRAAVGVVLVAAPLFAADAVTGGAGNVGVNRAESPTANSTELRATVQGGATV
ncbi:MAG: hypothetical protein U0163_05150 [Gemmatimonadaceae bacterium]